MISFCCTVHLACSMSVIMGQMWACPRCQQSLPVIMCRDCMFKKFLQESWNILTHILTFGNIIVKEMFFRGFQMGPALCCLGLYKKNTNVAALLYDYNSECFSTCWKNLCVQALMWSHTLFCWLFVLSAPPVEQRWLRHAGLYATDGWEDHGQLDKPERESKLSHIDQWVNASNELREPVLENLSICAPLFLLCNELQPTDIYWSEKFTPAMICGFDLLARNDSVLCSNCKYDLSV